MPLVLHYGLRDKFLAILGLSYSKELTAADIHRGLRRLAVRWHPDKLRNFSGADAPFQALQAVTDLLIEYVDNSDPKMRYGIVSFPKFRNANRALELWPPPRVPSCDKAEVEAFMKSYMSGNSSNPVDLTDDEEEKHNEERVERITYTPSTRRKRARRERHPLQLRKGDIIFAKFTGGDELGCIVGSCYGQPWGLKYGTYLVQYEPCKVNGKVSA
jgi:hypothetical protein